jgi:hypothetical protein
MALIKLELTDLLPDVVGKQNSNNLYTINNVAYAQTANDVAINSPLATKVGAGWNTLSATLTFSSVDHFTSVAATSVGLTGVISVGMRIKLTINSTTQYFIVTAITSTLITLYGGPSFALSNNAITNVFYSMSKCPFGFPADPAVWASKVMSTSQIPIGGLSAGGIWGSWWLDVDIGAWDISFEGDAQFNAATAGGMEGAVGLSTSSSSFSDLEMALFADSANVTIMSIAGKRSKLINIASKTRYYMVVRTTFATNATYLRGDLCAVKIEARCAYL